MRQLTVLTLLPILFISLAIVNLAYASDIEFIKEASQTYGYCFSQQYTLDVIKRKFPGLKQHVVKVNSLFDMNFKPACQKIEEFSKLIFKDEIGKHEQALISLLESVQPSEQITKEQAISFLKLVERRAKGEIESPFLETLLSFQPLFVK